MDTSSHVPQDYGHPESDVAGRAKAQVSEDVQQGGLGLEPDVSAQQLTSAEGSTVPMAHE